MLTLERLAASRAPGTGLLGLDLGTKTIGIAIADPALRVASPLETIKRKKFGADAERLKTIMDERRIGGLVLGLPLNMDGSEGPRCQATRAFARNLQTSALWPDGHPLIALWDERLSTAAVQRAMIDEADLTRRKRAQAVDMLAAAYILQGALDALHD